MYNDNDWLAYLEHGWGKKPEQKAKEKAYNAKYYKEHPEKWGKKEKTNVYYADRKDWKGNKIPVDNTYEHHQMGSDRLSEKYGVDYGHLVLADPKILEIGLKELSAEKYRMAVDNYAKEYALLYLEYPMETLKSRVKKRFF